MPPKKSGKPKGKQLDIMEFNDDYVPDDVYDWKDDDFGMTEEEKKIKKLNEKVEMRRRGYDRYKGLSEETNDFRNQERNTTKANTKGSKLSMGTIPPPYVLHVGNIRNGTTEAQFLSNFNKDTVEQYRLVNVKGATFACIEFKTELAARMVLLMDGTTLDGRKIHVDLATEEQIARLHNNNNNNNNNNNMDRRGMGLTRAGMGQQVQSSASLDLSRDAFGTNTPVMPSKGGSRSDFGSRTELTELTRDGFGTATVNNNNHSNSDTASPISPADKLANWRTTERETQPQSPLFSRNTMGNPVNKAGGNNNNNNNRNNNTAAPPTTGQGLAALENWRDTPPEKPKANFNDNDGNNNNNNNRGKGKMGGMNKSKSGGDIGDFRNK